jgi:hypothetical protein
MDVVDDEEEKGEFAARLMEIPLTFLCHPKN